MTDYNKLDGLSEKQLEDIYDGVLSYYTYPEDIFRPSKMPRFITPPFIKPVNKPSNVNQTAVSSTKKV